MEGYEGGLEGGGDRAGGCYCLAGFRKHVRVSSVLSRSPSPPPIFPPPPLLPSSPPRSEEVVLSVCRTRRLLPLRAAAHACLLKLTLRERWGKREEGGRRASDLRRPRSRDGAVYSARGSLCGGCACVSSSSVLFSSVKPFVVSGACFPGLHVLSSSLEAFSVENPFVWKYSLKELKS